MTEDQIIAQELAKIQRQETGPEKELVDEKEVYEKLAAPFPEEALAKDSSRGFDLTSVKAQYIVERLNEVLGVMNWTFGGEFKETEDGVLYMGALVVTINGRQNRQFAPGYSKTKKNVGDTYKGAHTDSLCKCASKFGIANAVFKGLVEPPGKTTKRASKAKPKGTTLTPKKEETKEEEVEKKPSSFNRRRSRKSL